MAKIFLGVGHGGSDPGAVANGFEEADLNLAIALACRDELVRHGVEVLMSRTKDENDTLDDEVKECNTYNPDYAVDFHNNAGGGDGVEAFYQMQNPDSKELAQLMIEEVKATGQNSRGIKTRLITSGANKGKDWYGFLRLINATAVLVEFAFVDTKDVEIIDTPAEQKAMGVAAAKAILRKLGIAYKKVTAEAKPTETKKPTATQKDDFLPKRGYFQKGDISPNVGKIAAFMRRVFPSYTSEKALGNLYGTNIIKSITEFQRRTGLEPDGFIGPLTLAKLEEYGFTR